MAQSLKRTWIHILWVVDFTVGVHLKKNIFFQKLNADNLEKTSKIMSLTDIIIVPTFLSHTNADLRGSTGTPGAMEVDKSDVPDSVDKILGILIEQGTGI